MWCLGAYSGLCLERLWGFLLWRFSGFTWTPTCATYCRVPALAQGCWTWWYLEVHSNHYDSMKTITTRLYAPDKAAKVKQIFIWKQKEFLPISLLTFLFSKLFNHFAKVEGRDQHLTLQTSLRSSILLPTSSSEDSAHLINYKMNSGSLVTWNLLLYFLVFLYFYMLWSIKFSIHSFTQNE